MSTSTARRRPGPGRRRSALYTLARLGLVAVVAGAAGAGRRAAADRAAGRADRGAAAVDGAVPRACAGGSTQALARGAGAAGAPSAPRCERGCAGTSRPATTGGRRSDERAPDSSPSPSPTAVSADQASSSRPVRASTGISSRPAAPAEHPAGQQHGQRRAGQGRAAAASCAGRPARENSSGTRHQGGVQPAGVGVAEQHGQRALAHDLVGRDVAQVVGHQHRAGEHAHGERARPPPALRAAPPCVIRVPSTATGPKKTNTATSPSPA